MQILAFDTSTDWLSAALYDGRDVVVHRERAGQGASARILPVIGELLAANGVSLSQLGGIAYGAGPGSFTGVRIACGIAQGLAFGADLPVYGAPALGALAQAAWRSAGANRVVACLDARMREVYVAAYVRDEKGWTLASGPAVCKPDAVVVQPGEWEGAGDGFAVYPQLVAQLALARCDAALFPDAQSVAEWAWPHLAAGEGVEAARAEPLYVRHRVALTSAERAAGMRL